MSGVTRAQAINYDHATKVDTMRTAYAAALPILMALLTLTQSAVAQQPRAAPMPRFDTSYVVLLQANPAYRPASDSATQATVQAHIAYQLRLIADQHTVMGGPMVPASEDPIVGMTVLRAASLDDALRLAREDPGVTGGLFTATVRIWTTARPGSF